MGNINKVAILALTCGRPEYTRRTWEHNLENAGCEYDLLWLDNGSSQEDFTQILDVSIKYDVTWFKGEKENKGIAYALNTMMKEAFARGNDAVFTMANDILEPAGFLQMRIDAANAIPNTGVVAIPLEGARRYGKKERNGFMIDEGQVIGNWLITKEAFEEIGLFRTDYGIYAPLDLDYCDRLDAVGMKRYYLSNLYAEHIGTDNPEEYERKKKASLAASWEAYKRNREKYSKGLELNHR